MKKSNFIYGIQKLSLIACILLFPMSNTIAETNKNEPLSFCTNSCSSPSSCAGECKTVCANVWKVVASKQLSNDPSQLGAEFRRETNLSKMDVMLNSSPIAKCMGVDTADKPISLAPAVVPTKASSGSSTTARNDLCTAAISSALGESSSFGESAFKSEEMGLSAVLKALEPTSAQISRWGE